LCSRDTHSPTTADDTAIHPCNVRRGELVTLMEASRSSCEAPSLINF
jgi:hypothetical protein